MLKALAAAVLALACVGDGGGKPALPAPEEDLDGFLFLATFQELRAEGPPADALAKVLEQDAEGRYLHFVYACPVCSPVVEAFRAFAMRDRFYFGRKGDPLVPEAGDGKALLADPAAALHDLVERAVARRVAELRMTDAEAARLRVRLAEGRKKGMSILNASKGFAHKSCPSCDAGAGEAWTPG